MPVIATPIIVAATAIVLSILAIRQRRWGVLRMAVILGWLGPLPGFLTLTVSPSRLTHFPSVSEAFGALGILLPYVAFAVPMFGSYCFIVGLSGGALIGRYTCAPAPRWIRPVAIVVMSALAAVPFILIEGSAVSGMGLAAMVSAASACVAILSLSGRIF